MNWLIRLLSFFQPKLSGDPEVWLERPWHIDPSWIDFKCGTCHGLYRAKRGEFEVLAVNNTSGGNGHFDRVLGHFEASARREKYKLSFIEICNPKFLSRLKSLGFTGDEKKMSKSYE